MMLLDKSRENAERIRNIGQFAREVARVAGASIYYLDRSLGGLVEELPSGAKQLVEVKIGMDRIVEIIGHRA